jgi:hypothetical protein
VLREPDEPWDGRLERLDLAQVDEPRLSAERACEERRPGARCADDEDEPRLVAQRRARMRAAEDAGRARAVERGGARAALDVEPPPDDGDYA